MKLLQVKETMRKKGGCTKTRKLVAVSIDSIRERHCEKDKQKIIELERDWSGLITK